MEKVVKPSTSVVDYNMIESDPAAYIILGFSNKKCVCTVHYENDEEWTAYYSSNSYDGSDYYKHLSELVDSLSKNYPNFELMCEKVNQI